MSECEHIDLVKEYNTYLCPHCGVYFEMVLVSELAKQIAAGVEIVEDELHVMETQRDSMIATDRIAGLALIEKEIKKRHAWLKEVKL